MKFNVGDEVEVVLLTMDADQKFKVGDVTRIVAINTLYNPYQHYLLEAKGIRNWWVEERCIQLVTLSLENA